MINKVKGTKDYNAIDFQVKEFIRDIFMSLIQNYNYQMIETPILEHTSLFKRSVADSEIANKEMYEFVDKGNREICLRPEGTASFVRALIENKWYVNNEKFAYFGPMFRYEQPQKGRYRQFYQAGVELIGEKNYYKDVEVIQLANFILNSLEIPFTLKINTIGDFETRQKYEAKLIEYLTPYYDQLSKQSQMRLDQKKALRILDDKVDSTLDFVKNAPKITEFLSKESKEYFDNVLKYLDANEISYEVSSDLVRGLDYYDEVVFEFVSLDENTGSQSTLIGGGRYSNLINQLGGPKLSSVGFGFGVDRLIAIIGPKIIESNDFKQKLKGANIFVAASVSQENLNSLLTITNTFLRTLFNQVHTEYSLIKSKKIFDKAKSYNASILICDDPKLPESVFIVKDLNTNEKIMFSDDPKGITDLTLFINDHIDPSDALDEEFLDELIEGVMLDYDE
ncbi:histidine--tRNA ligase [Mycoplasma sp. NEAQ87857]|uniref:histidine--tRNA ligase n=1 Tax=Mycoplasma sp. NEAQ87857 TaxID=2683967 RepID=UPI001319AE1F|nr:histidine--tRNA ligase [Mycoplasma sp. NEAQ87857]QGZ97755.1 histidine--tRNA ligase [Mycoplasma sp. NEAQ87857]